MATHRRSTPSKQPPKPIITDRKHPKFKIDAVIDSLPREHLHCRDFGHSWQPHTARVVSGGYEEHLRCARCASIRRRILSPHGAVLTSNYDYPDDYLIQGVGRITGTERDYVRLRSIKLIVDNNKDR